MTSFPDPTDPAGSRTEVFLRYLDYLRHLGHLDVVAELAGGPTGE
ncbi:hypothetical protein ACGF3C_27290 [Micromonospora sp. NPDC047762]